MTITLRNNTEIDLYGVRSVRVIKVLGLVNGRLKAKKWSVAVWKADRTKESISEFKINQYGQAMALKRLIIDMIIFTTTN